MAESRKNLRILRLSQTGKYVLRAEDLPRANILPCAQRPIKRAKFVKYIVKCADTYKKEVLLI